MGNQLPAGRDGGMLCVKVFLPTLKKKEIRRSIDRANHYSLEIPKDFESTSGFIFPLVKDLALFSSFIVISAGAKTPASTLKKSNPASLNVVKKGFP
jgi:hypothetical protein